ncbi:MAG: hypothetical protein R3D27_11870 [Hyphomicrobiaceae bacterium]
MLPPIKSFKPRVVKTAKPVKSRTATLAGDGIRGRRILLKQAQRVVPQPLAVLGESGWSRSC